MWESLKMGFYQTFILEDNYQYFVKGLGTTLTVTVFALVHRRDHRCTGGNHPFCI